MYGAPCLGFLHFSETTHLTSDGSCCGCAVYPGTTFLQLLQAQIPTARRFMASFPQNGHVYLECCVISIFFTVFLREAPYRVPYLPQIPTFFVRLAILT